MDSVLISIQPKWCELIARGKKTMEVRKTRPRLETPFKCFMYMTKDVKKHYYIDEYGDRQVELIPQKVIGEFVCDKVEKFTVGSLRCDDIEKLACLSYSEMFDYFYKLGELNDKTVKFGYAWHISDLKIYDKPKELREFYKPCNKNANCFYCKQAKFSGGSCEGKIIRPFQSWGYVEE